MDNAFAVLEDKVRRTAELVQSLRKQNASLQKELSRLKPQLEQARKAIESMEAKAGGPDAADLSRQLAALRQEREDVRRRLARVVETLDGLES